MTRYNQMFKYLKKKKEGGFIPFVVLGDPSPSLSLKIIDILLENGADALELGVPFSDPLADGPTIQKATLRALNSKTTLNKCFEMILNVRRKYPFLPIGLLMYANLIYNIGINEFYAQCATIGVDSVLVVDVPIEESKPFRQSAMLHKIDPIFICPPNAKETLLRDIAFYSRGYIYLLSRKGVTGTEKQDHVSLDYLITKLKNYNSLPIIQGFGISEVHQVKKAIIEGANGVISGSAIIKIIEENKDDFVTLHNKIKKTIQCLKNATRF